jgi:lysophospholipase L1-like esterase
MNITLIGDSVLDNFYWLSNINHDLKYELEQLGYNVNNFAVDESRVNDIIYGIMPRDIYQNSRYYPYPTSSDEKVHPLFLLTNNNCDLCVLSIGGNDFRINLWKLMIGVDHYINSVFTQEFSNNIDHILKSIKLTCSKIILIFAYTPYLGSGSNYTQFIKYRSRVYDRMFSFYRTMAEKYNIPLLDLNRTFNYNNRQHYGSTEIEPSNISNKCIADCIDYINNHYQGYSVFHAPNCNIDNIQVEHIKQDPCVIIKNSKCIIQ